MHHFFWPLDPPPAPRAAQLKNPETEVTEAERSATQMQIARLSSLEPIRMQTLPERFLSGRTRYAVAPRLDEMDT
jgi:hypothetical protein